MTSMLNFFFFFILLFFFFFQAEDGIRDIGVTGVQTCALPICRLDKIQLEDGRNKTISNRDDAAGYRLDTTYTHKQHKPISECQG